MNVSRPRNERAKINDQRGCANVIRSDYEHRSGGSRGESRGSRGGIACAVEAAAAKADSELNELRRQADDRARSDARELSGETENSKAALRAKAEARLDQAASLVVERIVKS